VDVHDKDLDFKYNEQALKAADQEQIKITNPIAPKGSLQPIQENIDDEKSGIDSRSFLESDPVIKGYTGSKGGITTGQE